MAKRKAKSQIGSLTPDHKKSGIDLSSMCAGGMRHAIRKLSTRFTTLLETPSQSKVWTWSYNPTKVQEFQPWQFRNSPLGVSGQKAIWMWTSQRGAKYTIWGKVVDSLKSRLWWVLWIWGRPWLVLTPKVFQHYTNQLIGWFDVDSSE
jgi:hypothetical protein